MHFEPSAIIPGRTAIDIHDEHGQKAATIYGVTGGIHITFEPGWTPDPRAISVDVQRPYGLNIGIAREEP